MKIKKDRVVSRKVFRKGARLVVSIPKEMLAFLGLQRGMQASIDYDAHKHCLLIKQPGQQTVEGLNAEFIRQVGEFSKTCRPVLIKLARK
jgi:antitoxin component of MazEF toxin-antitoxin module